MPYRYTYIRIVNPNNALDKTEYRPFNLLWAALAASEETMQGGLMASAWLGLFQSHLSAQETELLRWHRDLAESAEIRRAYSGMYGRYFSRGVLASRFGFTDFVSLENGSATLEGGVTVSRSKKGDTPDWIAWDPVAGSYVLAEAKGRLTGDDYEYLYSTPSCVHDGKAQFGRVKVSNSNGRQIRTRNWLAANLWSTDQRPRDSVSLLWDPDVEGEELLPEEVPLHAAAIRGHRIAKIARGLGRSESLRLGEATSGLAVRITIEPSKNGRPSESVSEKVVMRILEGPWTRIHGPTEEPAGEQHEDVYVASLVTPLGIRPILDRSDLDAAHAVQRFVREEGEPAMIYGLSTSALAKADYKGTLWLSGGGIVSTDGAGLFDLKEIQLNEA